MKNFALKDRVQTLPLSSAPGALTAIDERDFEDAQQKGGSRRLRSNNNATE